MIADWVSPELFRAGMAGVNLIFVIMGFVTLARMFGAKGKQLIAISLAIGELLGCGYFIATQGLPRTFADAFAMFMIAAFYGILSSLFYETLKGLAYRAIEKYVEIVEQQIEAGADKEMRG